MKKIISSFHFMKIVRCFGFSVVLLVRINASAQNDTIRFHNAIGIEAFGNTLPVLAPTINDLTWWNCTYQRFFNSRGGDGDLKEIKIGFSTSRTYEYKTYPDNFVNASRLYIFPLEAGVLSGRHNSKFDLAIGYTAESGQQFIETYVNGTRTGVNQYVKVNYYDFWTFRLGFTYIPSGQRHFPYIRIAYVPVWIPHHNPIPDPFFFDGGRHLILFNGGITIGGVF